MSTFNGIFLSLSHLGYFSHRRGCLLVLMGGQAEGQACADPGVRTPIERRRKRFCYASYSLIIILQTIICCDCLCISFLASKDISFMHCNQSISFYKYHFIHPCISIELFKFSFNSFHSLYLILHISNYQF